MRALMDQELVEPDDSNKVRKGKTIETYVPGIGAPSNVLEKFAKGL